MGGLEDTIYGLWDTMVGHEDTMFGHENTMTVNSILMCFEFFSFKQ